MVEATNISIDDDVLVQKCQKGDSTAMETLIIKYQNRVYNTIMRICANSDDAAELTQDTFVKVIEGINNFQRRSSLYTWIFRIAVNLTLNYCGRSVKLGIRSLDDQYDNREYNSGRILREFLSDDNSPDPAALAQNRELCGIVVKSLSELDDNQRAVMVLRDIEGMNYAQIADVLDIELGTVKSRLSRARNNLRQIMEAVTK